MIYLMAATPTLGAAEIAERDIAKLQEQFDGLAEIESATQVRRACKRIIRRALDLVEESPDAPQRYRVMHLVFRTQQRLYLSSQSEANVAALVETSKALREAPDDQAAYRLDPDMVLLQREMTRTDGVEQQCIAIARLADRYRGTSVEARSLMMCVSLAFDLGNHTLLTAFRRALTERFGHDPQVRAFLRERFASRKPIQFSGIYETADGQRISFPKGRRHVVCFWSRSAPNLDEKFAEVAELQRRAGGAVTVYSFNVDELADAGAQILKHRKVDWAAVHLPGGREHPLFVALGTLGDRAANLVVDPFGYGEYFAPSGSAPTVGSLHRRYEKAWRDPRQMAMWRSLLVGEYLLEDVLKSNGGAIPQAKLDAIGECFVPYPRRFRLTAGQELANYREAEKLCASLLAEHGDAGDVWRVNACRAVALLGRWRMTGKVAPLDEAATVAETLVSQPAAALVARYVMAIAELQRAGVQPGDVVAAFVEAVGGAEMPAVGRVAALMLALEGHLVGEYVAQRDALLSQHAADPATSWFVALMFDPRMAHEVFERALPARGATATPPPRPVRAFTAELTTLDGRVRRFPQADLDKGTAVVFIEDPADATGRTQQDQVIGYLGSTCEHHPMEMLAIFRSADPDAVRRRMAEAKWAFDAVALPDEVWHRLCREYGVISADRVANVLVLDTHGRVSVALTGLNLPSSIDMARFRRDIEPLLHDHERRLALTAMAEGRYSVAAERLEALIKLGAFQRVRHEPVWMMPNSYRRMLVWCHLQQEQWDEALAVINRSIDARFEHSAYIKGHVDHHQWCRHCHGHVFALATRVRLLEELGRDDEAGQLKAKLTPRPCSLVDGLESMWQAVDKALEGARARPGRYGSHERYLANMDKEARNRQPVHIYEFDIESDYLLRAKVLDKLGRAKEAAADRREAKLHAWPYEPRDYDFNLTHHAAEQRRERAAQLLDRGRAQPALEAMSINVAMHEAPARRANFLCRACGDQVQALRLRGDALADSGLHKEAELSRAMSAAAMCPPDGKQRDSRWYFPAGRMGWGHVTKADLALLDVYLAGGWHANPHYRRKRFALAEDLNLRARALAQLDRSDEAERDRLRAHALVFRSGPTWHHRSDSGSGSTRTLPARYVDLFGAESPG